MDRGARWAPVHGLAKSRTRLSDFTSLPVSGKTRVALWIPQVALVVKNPSTNAGDVRDMGSNPELGRSPGGRHGNPLQYSCLENPMDRGDWWAIVYRVKESDMTEWLTLHFFTVPFSSVAQSCPILCDPMDCSTRVFPVHHQLLELTQTHVHQVSDAIQPSHSLSSPF